MFDSLEEVVGEVSVNATRREKKIEARRLLQDDTSFYFVIHLVIIELVLEQTNLQSQALQKKKDQDLASAVDMVLQLKDTLVQMRDESCRSMWSVAVAFAELLQKIEIPDPDSEWIRTRARSRRDGRPGVPGADEHLKIPQTLLSNCTTGEMFSSQSLTYFLPIFIFGFLTIRLAFSPVRKRRCLRRTVS